LTIREKEKGMSVMQVDREIDARGMPCPGPLMALIGAIREEPAGAVIAVLSSDAGSRTDIPAWTTKARQELLSVDEEEGYTKFVVRKAR